MDTNKTNIYLRIHDFDCDPEEITAKVSTKPTNSWIKGDIIPNRNGLVKRKQSTWELEASTSGTDPVEDQMKVLLKKVDLNFESFREVIGEYKGEISIVMYLYEGSNPGINLDAVTLKKLANLGVEVDIDIYFLNSD